jgi:hypothetical protein
MVEGTIAMSNAVENTVAQKGTQKPGAGVSFLRNKPSISIKKKEHKLREQPNPASIAW